MQQSCGGMFYAGTDAAVYVQDFSPYTVTAETYSTNCDLTNIGTI